MCMIGEAKSDWFLPFCRILSTIRWELNTATVRLTLYDKSVGTGQMIGETWIWIKKDDAGPGRYYHPRPDISFKRKPVCIHG